MKKEMNDAEVIMAVIDWFKSISWSSWFLCFGALNILIVFLDLVLFSFGVDFIQEKKAVGGFVIFGLIGFFFGGILRME